MNILQTAVCFLALTPQVGDGDLPGLLKALDSPDANVRRVAARDIHGLAGGNKLESTMPDLFKQLKSAVPALFTHLKNEKSPEVRVNLLHAIGTISFRAEDKRFRPLAEIDEKILQGIASYLGDESASVRAAAANGLSPGRHKSKFAVPKLVVALEDEDITVKIAATRCLSLIGPDAAPALPLLRTELKTATEALKNKDHPARKKYNQVHLEGLRLIAEIAIRAIEKKDKGP